MILFWHSTLFIMIIFMTMKSSHPITMCLMLIFSAASTSILINFFINQWLMYAILLIFLGGMMVIFMYCSFMSNEDKLVMKFDSNLMLMLVLFTHYAFNPQIDLKKMTEISMLSQNLNSSIIWFTLLYLILSLILAVMFTKSFKGAMMKQNY